MDIQLPRISGLEATRRIKAREDLRRIPIVGVTSFALSGDDQKAAAVCCDAYIAKPYRPRDLLQLIKTLLKHEPH
jgi:two-component system cell cycle response regulator DivK